MGTQLIHDSMWSYISSQGECLRRYEEEGPNPVLLEALAENAEVVEILATELLSRLQQAQLAGVVLRMPPVDPHVEALKEEFLRRRASSPAQSQSS